MSTIEDQFHQFQIPDNGTFDVPLADNPQWDVADEAVTHGYDDRLGVNLAEADIDRRQREIDFNENQTETAAVCRELIAEIEKTNVVMDARDWARNDEGVINGVKVTGNV